ncbi:MAG: Xaa-Pro peptidase family protein [Dysgonamonadaceae bacterium]|jgi:Xaa-Pro aminopeptidase|nr:Xaa-Pro peptidase family protein [Dysgonamonadaceae bacterium]
MNHSKFPPIEDLRIRWNNVQNSMSEINADACLISSNTNIYYLTGRVFAGYVYLPEEGEPIEFVQRPIIAENKRTVFIRKPEDIPDILREKGYKTPSSLLLEADQITYNEYIRLRKVFNPAKIENATAVLRTSRMIKTAWEIEQMKISAKHHAEVYRLIPSVFRKGMKDSELQHEIEHLMRMNGSLGIFRTFGNNMDIFMGSLLAGKNAETPSPFNFALGGGGLSPCLPIGVNGDLIEEGQTIMVDMAGNFTTYITDMTRVYSYGTLPDIAYKAHEVSIKMHERFMNGKEGESCSDIYRWCLEMAQESGLASYFMGTVQQAKFTGHGVGIEINEPPVLTERSKDVLQENMTIAFEPKFVIPQTGAVGIENTYLIRKDRIENLTRLEEKIIELN